MFPACCMYAAKQISTERQYFKVLKYAIYKIWPHSAPCIIYSLCTPSNYNAVYLCIFSSISTPPTPTLSSFHVSLPFLHDILCILTWAYFAPVTTVGLPLNVN